MRSHALKLALIVFFFSAISCGKKKGAFTTDKSVYKQRELIKVTNTTVKSAKFYKWTFGTTQITAENPTFTIPDDTPAGSFEIKLMPTNSEATTSNWKEHSEFVTIEDAEEGVVTFWKKTNGQFTSGDIKITIDGVTKTITSSYSSAPPCGSSGIGCAVFTGLAKGNYDYTAVGSNINIGGEITISKPFDCVRELIE